MVFDEAVSGILLEAVQGKMEIPMNAFMLNQRFLSYGAVTLLKAVIFKIQDDCFWTNLHLLVNGEEKIECVNTAVALAAALRDRAPIVILEDVFIQAIQNPYAQEVAELFREEEGKTGS